LQGKKRKAVRPVRAELELTEGVTLLNGKRRVELAYLEGRSNKFEIDMLWAASPTDNRARAEWVLHAPEGACVTVKVLSDRAGTISKTVELRSSHTAESLFI
jgi:hypothetical protein